MNIDKYAEKGIKIIDPDTTYIDCESVIESGVIIFPNNTITGKSVIKKNTVLEPNNIIYDSEIGESCNIISSVIKESKVGSGVNIGPFAYLRPGSNIGDNCKIGDFVEVKASSIGAGTKPQNSSTLTLLSFGPYSPI